jgi:integrase
LTRLAVELTLLVFIRSSELRFACWSEIDFETSMWMIPAEREAIEGVKHSQRGSKMRTPHLVPLSRQALAILKQVHKLRGERDLVFHWRSRPSQTDERKHSKQGAARYGL